MAERRMFSKKIIDSDAFLDMPLSTQALYFHLSMRADDEGFVGNPRRIRSMIGASEDDLKLLIAKRFILVFESGVVVIKHWRIHNYINPDRFTPTTYVEEKKTLTFDEKKAYTEIIGQGELPDVAHDVLQNGDNLRPQGRLGKSRVGEDRKGEGRESKKESIIQTSSSAGAHEDEDALESYDEIMDRWEVEPMTRVALVEFIKHCTLNGKIITNHKLEDIISRLHDYYCYTEYGDRCDRERSKEVYRAIQGGWFDIKVIRR